MSLIRYQSPEITAWPALDRWSSLRDNVNSLFELPFWSTFGRQGEFFSGWSPALDLYQKSLLPALWERLKSSGANPSPAPTL